MKFVQPLELVYVVFFYNDSILSWSSSLRVIQAINLEALDRMIFWMDLGLFWSLGYGQIRNQYSFSFHVHTYIYPLSSIKTFADCVKWVIHRSILLIHKWSIILIPSCAYYVFGLKRKVCEMSTLKCGGMFDLAHNFQVQRCSCGLIIGPWLNHTTMKIGFIFSPLNSRMIITEKWA